MYSSSNSQPPVIINDRSSEGLASACIAARTFRSLRVSETRKRAEQVIFSEDTGHDVLVFHAFFRFLQTFEIPVFAVK